MEGNDEAVEVEAVLRGRESSEMLEERSGVRGKEKCSENDWETLSVLCLMLWTLGNLKL